MALEDSSLITIVKQMKSRGWKMAEDIGIVCYNDTDLKEIIEDGITVISTDFKEMGGKLAKMIIKNSTEKVEINISLTLRNSI